MPTITYLNGLTEERYALLNGDCPHAITHHTYNECADAETAIQIERDRVTRIRTVKAGFLWDCCDGNETHVIEFDNGSLHAVCVGCASRYTGPVTDLRATDLIVRDA